MHLVKRKLLLYIVTRIKNVLSYFVSKPRVAYLAAPPKLYEFAFVFQINVNFIINGTVDSRILLYCSCGQNKTSLIALSGLINQTRISGGGDFPSAVGFDVFLDIIL